METDKLLKEFPPVSSAEWQTAIARDLKIADPEEKLAWHTQEGMAVKPFYSAEDRRGLACVDAAPGQFPYRRGTRATGNWCIREEIDTADAEEANLHAQKALALGAEEIAFSRAVVRTGAELKILLRDLDEISIHFASADRQLMQMLIACLNEKPRAAQISTGCDALKSVEFAAEAILAAAQGFTPFTIHAEAFGDAGATAVEEIGFALAAGVDFLASTSECGVDVNRAAAAIEFCFVVGSNYFFEIAKLRTFRLLWARAVESFGGSREAARARVAVRTSRWNRTVYDPHVNVLRATTEAMAAVLGGADVVSVVPFDACYRTPDETSRRLARNTQLLLKHEAQLGRVADVGGGSYALEAITDLLAREGWKVMQRIEACGGFRKAQAEGAIAQTLERSLNARNQSVAARRRVLVGANWYANPMGRALDRVDLQRMNADPRGAREFEEIRLRTERYAAAGGRTPHVLLAEFGALRMRAARSSFAANFFACAGFKLQTRRFRKAADIAAADADAIILCGADPVNVTLVADLMTKLKELGRDVPVLVAGNPANAEELRAAGIADFVSLRDTPVEFLTKWQERLGVEG